ncbi:hypothetical protein GUITHDRAFT_121437 [Guillardia theta CCMP2712]|uniref:Uncharacterized protein n=1 Tax=Guillardia theta (strain CCMP2712) TaxID=905079 RepID=L1I8I6_GUITC|nr:hypothetical protein GUITHDRAFT_121437 [Guillardia theta CCMP2712]EKX32387.1 hypothetical protein GUITHDRAFT_121437 [Guillardia theta CCMP2712]|eukprot:XP_005819367.1 hypothetical protein GUITHDRAFT_121437 [Guillardia theta CCMP2712]
MDESIMNLGKRFVGEHDEYIFVWDEFQLFVKKWLKQEQARDRLRWNKSDNLTLPDTIQLHFSRPANFWEWFWHKEKKPSGMTRVDFNPFFLIPPTYFVRPIDLSHVPRTKYFVLPIYMQQVWFKNSTHLFKCHDHRRWRQIYKDLDVANNDTRKNAPILLHRFRIMLDRPYGIYAIQKNPTYSSTTDSYHAPGKRTASHAFRGRANLRGKEDHKEDIDDWLKVTKWGSSLKDPKYMTRSKIGSLLHAAQRQENNDMRVLYAFCQHVGLQFVLDFSE